MDKVNQWRFGVREERTPFSSEQQNARVWTEAWVAGWMYCPSCGAEKLRPFQNNNPAADFACSECSESFELKSQRGLFGSKIVDGAYATMSRRIEEKSNPSLLLLQYDREKLEVENLIVVPKHFFTLKTLERRRPLANTARRAGWVGCNILLGEVPVVGRISVVQDQTRRSKELVMEQWRQLAFLKESGVVGRGWLLAVLRCVEIIGRDEFSLTDVYKFEDRLARMYPDNSHVKQKIRQQLQVLRDGGYLDFLGRGQYRLRSSRN
jgi:type II restriction enzyme